jgi:hypothetical protein
MQTAFFLFATNQPLARFYACQLNAISLKTPNQKLHPGNRRIPAISKHAALIPKKSQPAKRFKL